MIPSRNPLFTHLKQRRAKIHSPRGINRGLGYGCVGGVDCSLDRTLSRGFDCNDRAVSAQGIREVAASMNGFYEWSSNLVDWYPYDGISGPSNGLTVSIVSQTTNGVATLTATPSSPVDKIFLRARVT